MKAIIFDIDDTLIIWKKEFIFALKNVLIAMNYEFDDEIINKIDKTIGNYEKVYNILSKDCLLEYINKECNLNLGQNFIDLLIEAQGECIYEDKKLIEIIEYLSKKYKLYAISNWFTKTQTVRLEKMGVAKYFKKIVGADKNYLKPDKRAYDIILKDYKNEECLSIGDNLENDVLIPISLGLKAIWKSDKEHNLYITIKNLEELMNIL